MMQQLEQLQQKQLLHGLLLVVVQESVLAPLMLWLVVLLLGCVQLMSAGGCGCSCGCCCGCDPAACPLLLC
jgi:hypothetical protein